MSLFEFVYFQLKTAINRATSRNDLLTIRDALEVSSDMYKKDSNNVPDYIQRHLISLSIWEELRYYMYYFFMISVSGICRVKLSSCTSLADFGKDILTI